LSTEEHRNASEYAPYKNIVPKSKTIKTVFLDQINVQRSTQYDLYTELSYHFG